MEKRDARHLSQDVQHELRKQVVRLRKKGMKNVAVAEIVGISVTYASTIWTNYKAGGAGAIAKKKRGRRGGELRKLTPEQEKEIKRMIVDKTPDQLKFPFALWTRQAIQGLIKREYKIDIPLRTLSDYLRRWGFSSQKPARRAYEQQGAKVKHWLDEEYPAILKQAKQEGAEIYWGDETGIECGEYMAKGFSPKGKTPIVRLNAKKTRINMISAISNRGTVRFMFYKETFNSDKLISFMKRLHKDAKRKVYLILDNLRVHHSKKVAQWLKENEDHICVFFLPPYSPELNPDEYLNGDLKRHVHSGVPVRNEKELHKKARGYMMKIQRRCAHICSYFKNKHVLYAA
jgi:transposase